MIKISGTSSGNSDAPCCKSGAIAPLKLTFLLRAYFTTMVLNSSVSFDNETKETMLLEDDDFFAAIDEENRKQQAIEKVYKAQLLHLQSALEECRVAYRKRMAAIREEFGAQPPLPECKKKLTRKEKQIIRNRVKIWSQTDPQSGICSRIK